MTHKYKWSYRLPYRCAAPTVINPAVVFRPVLQTTPLKRDPLKA